MYQLYYAPVTAAMAPQAALEEIGADYELVEVDLKAMPPDYLKLNPHGRIPTLVDDGTVLYEAAAIMLYLADRHPEAGLVPAAGERGRGRYYQWLLYLADTVQPAFKRYSYPHRFSTDIHHVPAVKARAVQDLAEFWGKLDDALDPGPYLLGERFSGCDLYLHMLSTWVEEDHEPISGFPNVTRSVAMVAARPAVQRMLKTHGLA